MDPQYRSPGTGGSLYKFSRGACGLGSKPAACTRRSDWLTVNPTKRTGLKIGHYDG